MRITLTGILILCGAYGSGKTETALNLASLRKADGIDVNIADLDLINPYFRSKDAKAGMERQGIHIILPDSQYDFSDLPILAPSVAGIIRHPSGLTILDTGGDDCGATVLSALHDPLVSQPVQMLQVINPFRPSTRDIDGCLRIRDEIQEAANLAITGLVSNANLMDHTTLENIYEGYRFVQQVSNATGLDIKFITAVSKVLPQINPDDFSCPVLEIQRKLSFPWDDPAH